MTPPTPDFKLIDRDALEPSLIEHLCEEFVVGGQLSQKYSYLRYHFSGFGAHCWARSYLEDIGRVTLYGPFTAPLNGEAPLSGVENKALIDAARAYLNRRYREVTVSPAT